MIHSMPGDISQQPSKVPDSSALNCSVIVPLFNEALNLNKLVEELRTTFASVTGSFEILLVDDGSTDGTRELIDEMAQNDHRIKPIHIVERQGKSAAWSRGFERARGKILIVIDGDLQNDPQDIPRLIENIPSKVDFVSGRRVHRKAGFIDKRLPSLIGNQLLRFVSGSRLHDHGCGLKAFRSECVSGLFLAEGMHRWLSVLVERRGFRVAEIEVNDRPRIFGESKFGLSRLYRFPIQLLKFVFSDALTFGTLAKSPD